LNAIDSWLHKPGVAGSSPAAATTCHAPAEEYHGWGETSCSDLKLLAKSPLEYYWRKVARVQQKQENTAALDYGTLLHTWGELGEEEFWRLVVTPPADLCTAAGAMGAKAKAWLADQSPESIPVSPADLAKLRPQTEALLRNKEVVRLIDETVDRELNVRSRWEGHAVRSRIDALTNAGGFDWKTTSDRYPLLEWARSAIKWGYHLQSAFYTEILTHIGYPRERIRFVVTSTAWPYENVVCQLPDALCQAGHRECLRLLEELEARREWDFWDRYGSTGTVELPVPSYLMKGL